MTDLEMEMRTLLEAALVVIEESDDRDEHDTLLGEMRAVLAKAAEQESR